LYKSAFFGADAFVRPKAGDTARVGVIDEWR
jgi:hypothetical protein